MIVFLSKIAKFFVFIRTFRDQQLKTMLRNHAQSIRLPRNRFIRIHKCPVPTARMRIFFAAQMYPCAESIVTIPTTSSPAPDTVGEEGSGATEGGRGAQPPVERRPPRSQRGRKGREARRRGEGGKGNAERAWELSLLGLHLSGRKGIGWIRFPGGSAPI